MPRIPCMVCRTTVSTPVKFLLQCSCGIGLHHTCIVPAIPKQTLLLMVKASTNGCHANSLDDWQCPGCKATENVKQAAPTIKKRVQPHPPKKLDPVLPARVRIDDKMRKGVQPPPPAVSVKQPVEDAANDLVDKPSKDPKPVNKRLKTSRHPSVQPENEKEMTRLVPAHNPKPPSTNNRNAPHQPPQVPKDRESGCERVVTANADINRMAQQPSPKVLPTHNNDVSRAELPSNPPVNVGQVQKQPKAIPKPTQNTFPPPIDTPWGRFVAPPPDPPVKVGQAQPKVITKPSQNTLQTFVDTPWGRMPWIITPHPPIIPKNAPPPPMLDLCKVHKRKRPHTLDEFKRHLHMLPTDESGESPAKRRRLNSHLPLQEMELVVESSGSSHVKDVNQPIQLQASTTPMRLTSNPIISGPPNPIAHKQDQSPKDDNDMVQDIRPYGIASDSESTNSNATKKARLVEDSPTPDIEAATTHSEGRGSSHVDAPTTSSNEASPRHNNEPATMADLLESAALYSGLDPSPLPMEQNEPSDDSSMERSEVDRSLSEAIVDSDSQNGSEPISNHDEDVSQISKTTCPPPSQEMSFTDGLLTPRLTDEINDRDRDLNEQPLDTDVAEHDSLDRPTTGFSDFADQMCKDKPSIAAPSDHSEDGTEESEVLTQLDAIVQRLPQRQSRPSFKLPKVTLPVLATCFGSFKATSKRVGVGL